MNKIQKGPKLINQNPTTQPMSDQNNLVWVNKKTNKIATKSELEDMWETPKHDFELKEIHQEEIKTINKDQTTINFKIISK